MNSISQVAEHLRISKGEIIQKLELIGEDELSEGASVNRKLQTFLRRTRFLSPEQSFRVANPKRVVPTIQLNKLSEETDEYGVISNLAEIVDYISQIDQRLCSIELSFSEVYHELDQFHKKSDNNVKFSEDEQSFDALNRSEVSILFEVDSEVKALQFEVQSLNKELSTFKDMLFQVNELWERIDKIGEAVVGLQFGSAQDSSLRNEIDSVRDQVEEALSLEGDINAMHMAVEGIKASGESLRSGIDEITARISDISDRLIDLEEPLYEVEDLQAQFQLIAEQSRTLHSPLPLPNIVALESALEGAGLFFDRSVLEECISGLTHNWGLMLVGMPGVGKSALAQFLSRAFWPEENQLEILAIHEANECWRASDILGGRLRIGNSFAPSMGIVSKAVVDAVGNRGRRWIFIDEFNRCDSDKAFSGLLGCFGGNPMLSSLLALPGSEYKIKIPPSFRVIFALNDCDSRHLYPISRALESRFQKVRIRPPSMDKEFLALRHALTSTRGDRLNIDHRFREDFQNLGNWNSVYSFLGVVNELRNLISSTSPEVSSIGTRETLRMARSAIQHSKGGRGGFERDLARELVNEVRSMVLNLPINTLEALSANVFPGDGYSEILTVCEQALSRRVSNGPYEW